ncbi:hypothetical protein U9M48_030847 [Paspalum notatum var. saurae]|uniref:Uncharacterized protein n=1 Tax=Paspalum notatum var. saurae TaxID=547442 RepID=A0AAQ3X327_PASNO
MSIRKAWHEIFNRSSAAPLRRYCAGAARGTRRTPSTADSTADYTADKSNKEDPYCYTVGQFGRIALERSSFVPLRDFVKSFPPFEPVPPDRLISQPDPTQPLFISEMAKDWMRSGFVAIHFGIKLGLPIKAALVEGNVGVIQGLNVIAFLKLDLSTKEPTDPPSNCSGNQPSNSSGNHPSNSSRNQPFALFAHLLLSTIEAENDAQYMTMLPEGFKVLMKCAAVKNVDPCIIIYSPVFMKLHELYALFVEAYRIIRKEMPAQEDAVNAHSLLQLIANKLHPVRLQKFQTDTMIRCWLGSHGKTNAPTKSYKDAAGNTILKYPVEALVLDVHRHCMVRIVEKTTLIYIQKLPPSNRANLAAKPVGWHDGVHLMLHSCPELAHHIVEVFSGNVTDWIRLDLETRFPLPSVFFMPSCDQQSK